MTGAVKVFFNERCHINPCFTYLVNYQLRVSEMSVVRKICGATRRNWNLDTLKELATDKDTVTIQVMQTGNLTYLGHVSHVGNDRF